MKLSERLGRWADLAREQEHGKQLQFDSSGCGDWGNQTLTENHPPRYLARWRVKPEPRQWWLLNHIATDDFHGPFTEPRHAEHYRANIVENPAEWDLVHVREVVEE